MHPGGCCFIQHTGTFQLREMTFKGVTFKVKGRKSMHDVSARGLRNELTSDIYWEVKRQVPLDYEWVAGTIVVAISITTLVNIFNICLLCS